MRTKSEQAWDRNPTNNSTCLTHGPYIGLICTPCIITLPPRRERITPVIAARGGDTM